MGVEQMETTSPPPDSRLLSLRCPNSYYAYPKLHCIAAIPEPSFATLDVLWKRSIHPGRDVNLFRLHNVFVAKEGLVFDATGRLYDVTRTYHSDGEIAEGYTAVLQAIASGNTRSFKKGILTKSRGSSNYGHFILEMLPRAWLARTSLTLTDWPAIIDATSPIIEDVARQALNAAGFDPDHIIPTDQAPAFFEEIVVVDGLTSHSQYISPFVMQCLDIITGNVPDGPAKDIYVPRRPAISRDFENEPAISAHLQHLGFRETRTAELPFLDQIAAFKGAQTVVAVSGAALTNLVFCKPGTRVFNFSPCSAMEVLFWMIAEARHLDYREIRCAEIGPQNGGLPWDRTIKMTPREIERILKAA